MRIKILKRLQKMITTDYIDEATPIPVDATLSAENAEKMRETQRTVNIFLFIDKTLRRILMHNGSNKKLSYRLETARQQRISYFLSP